MPSLIPVATAVVAARAESANLVIEGIVYDRCGYSYYCESSFNPVVLLHGLGATYYEDLNYMQYWLQTQGCCDSRGSREGRERQLGDRGHCV
jgi:hypothetical protein